MSVSGSIVLFPPHSPSLLNILPVSLDLLAKFFASGGIAFPSSAIDMTNVVCVATCDIAVPVFLFARNHCSKKGLNTSGVIRAIRRLWLCNDAHQLFMRWATAVHMECFITPVGRQRLLFANDDDDSYASHTRHMSHTQIWQAISHETQEKN